MLYLIATPIGNLKDITYRAIDTLRTCDYLLCEDTRTSSHLLKHYEISTPLKSFHQFNEASREDQVVADLKEGKNVGLITDAGTPCISDPGYRLVRRCRKEGLEVSSIPGACAAVTALSGSGLPSDRFQFIGFLPKKQGPLKEALIDTLLYEGTTITYESPHRLVSTLELLNQLYPKALICVCRELTKKFEDYAFGQTASIYQHYHETPPKGEIVLLIQGGIEKDVWKTYDPKEMVIYFQELFDLSPKEALKLAADQSGLPKRELYKQLH